MLRSVRAVVSLTASLLVISTPFIWLLSAVNTARVLGAAAQALLGVVVLVWSLFQRVAVAPTGRVVRQMSTASAGSAAVGARRGTSVKSESTERVAVTTDDSSAVSGIDYK